MGERRQARELALQALFFFDMDKSEELISDFDQDPGSNHDQRLTVFCDNNKEKLDEGVEPFFLDLVNGVEANKVRIDTLLNKYSKNWKISRMPVVDRNIMRIALFELINRSDIPSSVTINEAVEIGKIYGTRDSGSFINGVLDRIKSSEGFE